MGKVKMVLYHGSNLKIEVPKIIDSKRLLDFGSGFYLTSDFGQAAKWATHAKQRRKCGESCVNVFEVDEANFSTLKTLVFESANKAWLLYICKNRTSKTSDFYDIVAGPVANDQVIRTVNNYLSGYLTQKIALELLKTQKLKDQYAFKTEKALSILNFTEVKIL